MPADTFGFSPSQTRRPRDPGPALGAAASPRLPVGLCVCLCVCLLSSSLPPLLELNLWDTDIPRILAPLLWQVSGRKVEGLRYPPTDLVAWCQTHPPGMCSDWLCGAPPFLPEKPPPCSPAPSFSFSSHFPRSLAACGPSGKGMKSGTPSNLLLSPPQATCPPKAMPLRPHLPTL